MSDQEETIADIDKRPQKKARTDNRSFHCDCHQRCGGVPRPVSEKTWRAHTVFRGTAAAGTCIDAHSGSITSLKLTMCWRKSAAPDVPHAPQFIQGHAGEGDRLPGEVQVCGYRLLNPK